MSNWKCRHCPAVSKVDNVSSADGLCLNHPAGVGNHSFVRVSSIRVMNFISSVRSLARRWKTLSHEQKQAVLDAIGEDSNAEAVLQAIKNVRKIV